MNLGFSLTPYSAVREVIENWKPKIFDTEEQYEGLLERELKKNLKNQKIDRQYTFDEQRADIVVRGDHDEVPIELKNYIRSDQTINDIMIQLDGYLKRWNRVFLVICGDVSDDRLKTLKEYAEKKQDILDFILGIEIVDIILKGAQNS